MIHYGGKLISDLTDRQLALAEEDVANCLLRAYAAPASAPVPLDDNGLPRTDERGGPLADKGRYGAYFERMKEMAVATQAEKERRA